MHELRAEAAETKVAAESKFAEARGMVENAQKKSVEADAKLHAAESLQAEANRYHRAAERKLKEVEAREEDLSRRIISFKSEYVFIHLVCALLEASIVPCYLYVALSKWGLVWT